MNAPGIWDARDPFGALVGKRFSEHAGSAVFGGFAFMLSVAWLPFGCAVTGGDNGVVTVHDFFHSERVLSGDNCNSKLGKTAVEWGHFDKSRFDRHGYDASGNHRKHVEKSVGLSVGAVWSVDAKPFGTQGMALVAAGSGVRLVGVEG
jgi:hypothetical protein